MKINEFKAGMARGEAQIGLWISLCSPLAVDVIADAGYDWLLMDMEHAPAEIATVQMQFQAAHGHGSTVLARPSATDPVISKRLLDAGSQGLIFPMVQTRQEAEAAVAGCLYPPRGIRGVSSTQRGNRYGRVTDYFEKVEQETSIIVQVETREALDRVEDIASVEGVDGVFFGPADIAASMGMLGQVTNAEMWDQIFDAAAKVQALGKPCGTLIGDEGLIHKALEQGFLFVAIGSDHAILARSAEALLGKVRALKG